LVVIIDYDFKSAIVTSIIESLLLGFSTILEPWNLIWCLIGVFIGTVTGVLPGVSTAAALSLLLPLTYHMDPIPAILVMAGVIYGVQYGGAIASILLNVPGNPTTAITCLDGYPMGQQGRGKSALLTCAISSFVGSIIGVLVMIIVAPWLSRSVFLFGPAEYFSIMIFGIMAAAAMSRTHVIDNLALVIVGMMFGMVGTDTNSGAVRLTGGIEYLSGGISVVIVAMGIFGISEVIYQMSSMKSTDKIKNIGKSSFNLHEIKSAIGASLRGGAVGSFFGTLPGPGPTIASFSSYMLETHRSKNPERFGKGAIEGVAGPESANNAAAQTGFIPTMTLGIPGDATMVLVISTLIMQGVVPGPTLITNHPELFWGLVASFIVGNLMLLVLNIPLIPLWVKILSIPYRFMYPAILILVTVGVYLLNNNYFDMILVMMFGIFGYYLKRANYSGAPLLIGFVLGPLMEEYLRRGLMISQGDFSYFISSGISVSFLMATLLLFVWALMKNYRKSS
jgi:putative tricarboxylic transport membrane protein